MKVRRNGLELILRDCVSIAEITKPISTSTFELGASVAITFG